MSIEAVQSVIIISHMVIMLSLMSDLVNLFCNTSAQNLHAAIGGSPPL